MLNQDTRLQQNQCMQYILSIANTVKKQLKQCMLNLDTQL